MDSTGALGIGASANGAVWSSIQGSIRARAGYAFDRMLFYGTAGVAFGEFGGNFQIYGNDTNLATFYGGDQLTTTRVGWTLGGGVEYAINRRWSVTGEYRYSDFGHLTNFAAAGSTGVFYTADRHLDQQQVQMGVSYKLGDVSAAPIATNAIAADLPSLKGPPTASSQPLWTGFYAGLNVGGIFAVNANTTSSAGALFDDFNPAAAGIASASSATGMAQGTHANLIGGAQAGANYQFNSYVVAGLEADLQGVPGSNSNIAYGSLGVDPLGSPTTMGSIGQLRLSLDYLGTLRGRIGVLLTPSLLVYGSGGLAYGGANFSAAYSTVDLASVYGAGSGYSSYSGARAGWTGSGGLEWLFAPQWSAKLEYLYYDLGTATTSTVIAGPNSTTGATGYAYAVSTSAHLTSNAVRAGLNYHFNWADAAPAVTAKY